MEGTSGTSGSGTTQTTTNSGTTTTTHEYQGYPLTWIELSTLSHLSSFPSDTLQVTSSLPVSPLSHPSLTSTLTSLPSISYTNTRLFTGREYDSETGFYYYRARHYNPQTGRFLQRDPIGQNDQINLYTYVGNSPVMYVDPDGRIIKQAVTTGWNYTKNATSSAIEGGIKGDFIQNPNGWNIAGQIGAGFIPFYGQGADLRDVGAAWSNCSGGWSCAGQLGLAGIGFVPGIGDGLKVLGKGAKHTDEVLKVAEESFQISGKKIEQLRARGWDDIKIEEAIRNPLSTARTIDKATGEEATAYFVENNQYIVRGDTSGKIIQGSNLHDIEWKVPDFFK